YLSMPISSTSIYTLSLHDALPISQQNLDTDEQVGPGLRWCLSAQVGSEVGIWTAQGLWHRANSAQTLIADPSALPSLRAILEYTDRKSTRLNSSHVSISYAGFCLK